MSTLFLALSLLGCDLSEPVLEDEVAQAEEGAPIDPASVCVDIEACCGVDMNSCEYGVAQAIDALEFELEQADASGLDLVRDDACSPLPDSISRLSTCTAQQTCTAPCHPWVGSVPAGGTCTTVGSLSDCAQGLSCFAVSSSGTTSTGVCADPCDTAGLSCNDAEAFWSNDRIIEGSWACGPAGYCDAEFGAWGECAPVLSLGDPCSDENGCGLGLYCDLEAPSPICAPQKGSGEPCARQAECLDGNICSETCIEEWKVAPPEAPLGCAWAANQE